MIWYRQQGNYAVKDHEVYRMSKADSVSFLGKYVNYNWVLSGLSKRIPIKLPAEVESAYRLELWAEVDGFQMKIWNEINGKYSMEPTTEEMANHFGVGFEPDKYQSRYKAVLKSEEEIDSIWEVRTLIEGFPFNTEKVIYLKMYGDWLEGKV